MPDDLLDVLPTILASLEQDPESRRAALLQLAQLVDNIGGAAALELGEALRASAIDPGYSAQQLHFPLHRLPPPRSSQNPPQSLRPVGSTTPSEAAKPRREIGGVWSSSCVGVLSVSATTSGVSTTISALRELADPSRERHRHQRRADA